MKIIHVMGARQNFVKITSIVEAIEKHSHAADPLINQCLIHIGQHVVERMSKLFFDDLGITKCGINRDVGSGAHVTLTDGTNLLAGMHKEKIIEAAHACLTFPQLRSERRMNSSPYGTAWCETDSGGFNQEETETRSWRDRSVNA